MKPKWKFYEAPGTYEADGVEILGGRGQTPSVDMSTRATVSPIGKGTHRPGGWVYFIPLTDLEYTPPRFEKLEVFTPDEGETLYFFTDTDKDPNDDNDIDDPAKAEDGDHWGDDRDFYVDYLGGYYTRRANDEYQYVDSGSTSWKYAWKLVR